MVHGSCILLLLTLHMAQVEVVVVEPTPPTTTVATTSGGGALGEALGSHMLCRKSTGTLKKRLRQLFYLSRVAALMVCWITVFLRGARSPATGTAFAAASAAGRCSGCVSRSAAVGDFARGLLTGLASVVIMGPGASAPSGTALV